MRMTLAQYGGFLAAVAREDTRRFANAAAATRLGMAEDKSYRSIMEKLEKN